MHRRRVRPALVGLIALGLVSAACGSSSKGSSSTNGTVDQGVRAGVQAALNGSATTAAPGAGSATTAAAQPTSMDAWEALWAQQRAAIVQRAKTEGWGKSADGKTVTGPSGFKMDLTKCPGNWSDTEGLTDTSIKVGLGIAQSGPLAEYNYYTKGIAAVFDYYNKKGVFKDVNGKTRTVDFTVKDDGYDPAKTIPIVDEYLDSSKMFAIWTAGSPSTLKTYDKINQRCVPNPFAITAHAAWGDPVNHPWTTAPPGLAYATEAVLWGSFLEQHLSEFPTDRKITVAGLFFNNDFGKQYDSSLRAYIAQSAKLKDRVNYVFETIESSAPTITDPMTTLASKNPDVFILMTAGTTCTQAVTEAAQNGMKDKTKYLFQPNTCAGPAFVKKDKVGGDGSSANGWWIVNPGSKDLTDPAFANDPFVQWAKQTVQAAGTAPNASGLISPGIVLGWTFVQSLLIADELPGGLNRTNFVLAQRGLDMTNPMFVAGVKFHMDGNKDAYLIEAGGYQQWDSAQQTWVQKTQIVDLDGQSKLCAWDAAAAVCK